MKKKKSMTTIKRLHQQGLAIPFFFLEGFLLFLSLFLWQAIKKSPLSLEPFYYYPTTALLLFFTGFCVFLVYKIFFGVIGKINNVIYDLGLDKQKALSYEKEGFSDNVNFILRDYSNSSGREASYQLLQKQAEFDALQTQINPHFLYNSLDSIRGKALEENSVETADMLETLAIMFRYSISSSSKLVTIEEELDNMNHFFRIQQHRFSDRFTLSVQVGNKEGEIENSLLGYQIPKLSLQPILENAMYHGLGEISEGGKIGVHIYQTQTRVEIVISDNGVGMSLETLKKLNFMFLKAEYMSGSSETKEKNSGIALENINARLKFTYGPSYGLTAYSTPNIGTQIVVSIPIKENE